MSRRENQANSRKTAWVGGVFLLLCLAACEPFWSPPEGRAQDFIETLVMTPTDTQKLRDIANITPDRNPEDLLDGLASRIALDFLRAKLAQDVTLKFAQSDARKIDATRRSVAIRVTYLEPGAPTNSEVRFQVQSEKDAQDHWHIARVTGSN